MNWTRLIFSLTIRAIVSPTLAIALLQVAWRFRVRNWWAKFPFLPLPSMKYLRWRMYTAYGDEAAVPPVSDVIAYARWTAKQP